MARKNQITVDLSSEAERDSALAGLLMVKMIGQPMWQPIPIPDGRGRTLGYFMPVPLHSPKPPVLTPAELAELQRRLENRDDSLTADEMIELLEKEWDEEAVG